MFNARSALATSNNKDAALLPRVKMNHRERQPQTPPPEWFRRPRTMVTIARGSEPRFKSSDLQSGFIGAWQSGRGNNAAAPPTASGRRSVRKAAADRRRVCPSADARTAVRHRTPGTRYRGQPSTPTRSVVADNSDGYKCPLLRIQAGQTVLDPNCCSRKEAATGQSHCDVK
jgi:hypothetical protein